MNSSALFVIFLYILSDCRFYYSALFIVPHLSTDDDFDHRHLYQLWPEYLTNRQTVYQPVDLFKIAE